MPSAHDHRPTPSVSARKNTNRYISEILDDGSVELQKMTVYMAECQAYGRYEPQQRSRYAARSSLASSCLYPSDCDHLLLYQTKTDACFSGLVAPLAG